MTARTDPFNGFVRALLMLLFWYPDRKAEKLGDASRAEYERTLLERRSPNVTSLQDHKRKKAR